MKPFRLILIQVLYVLANGSQIEQDLSRKILNDYDTRIRPSSNPNEIVPVTVKISLLKLSKIDEEKGNADIGLSISMAWNDSRLSWTPSDYKGVKKLIIPSMQVWIPDLCIFTGNGAVEEFLGANENYTATAQSNGELHYAIPFQKQFPCIHKTDKNSLSCLFEVESWVEDTDYMSLKTTENVMDTSLLGTNIDPSYKIKSASYEEKVDIYPDILEKWDSIKGRIVLDRKK